jgi:hypothetical protein
LFYEHQLPKPSGAEDWDPDQQHQQWRAEQLAGVEYEISSSI